jgi:3',5'-cyclic AMP phosphodiesterase CpdA
VTRIAHLSDLHFGAHDPVIVAASAAWLAERQPDLVIISGDLTQRARSGQFQAAAAYVAQLHAAGLTTLVVPGNHDVPLFDVVRRFGAPLARYRRYISDDICPWFENDDVAVLGINTARSLTFADGRINRDQMQMVAARFAAVAPAKTRILVTHHPLYAMPIGEGDALTGAVGRHHDAVAAVSGAGVHLALAGHFHRTYADAARKMVENAGDVLVIQAGTATSVRLRNDERQSFNWIHAHRHDRIELQVIAWNGTAFARGQHVQFDYGQGGWTSATIQHPAPIA